MIDVDKEIVTPIRQTWNWCERKNLPYISIFMIGGIEYFSDTYSPAKRLVGLQIVNWPDEKTLCVEEPKTKLDTYVIYHVRRFLDPQGVKYE